MKCKCCKEKEAKYRVVIEEDSNYEYSDCLRCEECKNRALRSYPKVMVEILK